MFQRDFLNETQFILSKSKISSSFINFQTAYCCRWKTSEETNLNPPLLGPRIEDDYEDEDDEEYDSEMDDFIDDGPEEGSNVSKYIQEIFGYDKRRFRDEDDGDCGDMESSFVQQMREEAQSLKIGIMEDLEDIRKEEEEKALKAALKKKQHAKGRIWF